MGKTLAALGALWLGLVGAPSAIQANDCPGPDIRQCRHTAPKGQLLNNANSAGARVWTTNCGQPNTAPASVDALCEDIASCPAAGAFGKFLGSVTGNCRSKHFTGYFGLDGMTYGILDWTAESLPATLAAYGARSSTGFDKTFGPLALPMVKGCLDPNWVCQGNQQGRLMCDAGFREAFARGLNDAEFQKAQVDLALQTYERRLKRFASLGLKTEYGNTAMVVVANNLKPKKDFPECDPFAWKQACAAKAGDERSLVDCMLDQYVKHTCRGGSAKASKERSDEIRRMFANAVPSEVIHPSAEDIVGCSSRWGATAKP